VTLEQQVLAAEVAPTRTTATLTPAAAPGSRARAVGDEIALGDLV
jgi:hypothetical protein